MTIHELRRPSQETSESTLLSIQYASGFAKRHTSGSLLRKGDLLSRKERLRKTLLAIEASFFETILQLQSLVKHFPNHHQSTNHNRRVPPLGKSLEKEAVLSGLKGL